MLNQVRKPRTGEIDYAIEPATSDAIADIPRPSGGPVQALPSVNPAANTHSPPVGYNNL